MGTTHILEKTEGNLRSRRVKTTRAVRALPFLLAAHLMASPVSAAAGSVQCDGTWQIQPTPTNHDFQIFEAVSATSSDDAWAVGSYDDYDVPPGLNPLMAHWD